MKPFREEPGTGWAISRRTADILTRICVERRPRNLVDVGTGEGVSLETMIASAPGARIVTIESNKLYLQRNWPANVIRVHAPLEKRTGWYAWEAIQKIGGPFDLLFVDGPEDSNVRHLALGGFYFHLEPSSVILLDDANRPGEAQAISTWTEFLTSRKRRFKLTLDPEGRGLAILELEP